MTETHSTTTSCGETFQRQYPLALIALAEHMLTHQLPAPLDILVVDEDRGGRPQKVIRLHLPGQHTHAVWLDSLVVDAQHDDPAVSGFGIRSEWSVRLPDTGFRFQVVGYRHELSVVAS